jgi:quinol-cytochrome oxidoreductase complex cytochrome b subunit
MHRPSGGGTRTLVERITESAVWRSVVRHGRLASNFERARVVMNNFFLHIHPVKVRERSLRFTTTFYLGGLAIGLFFILTVSGVLLMLYYRPSVPRAYQDIKDLEYVVSSGLFFRNVHRWAAHLMVLAVFLHMLRVFYSGAYLPPRQFNWVLGVIMLLATLLLSYTGYLLPWDQLAFWGVSVGTNMLRAVPVIGDDLSFVLLGGNLVGENALLRFYVLHIAILPGVLTVLIAVHIWRVRKDGQECVEVDDASSDEGEEEDERAE